MLRMCVHAVCMPRRTSLQYCSGSLPPSTSISASLAYGTEASSTVFEAPGTESSQDTVFTPPPVT